MQAAARRGAAAAAAMAATSFHSTAAAALSKSTPRVQFNVREKRADAKSALKNILLNGGPFQVCQTGETLMMMTPAIAPTGALAARRLLPGTGLGRMMTLAVLQVGFSGGMSLDQPNRGEEFGMKVMWTRKMSLAVMI